MSGYQGKTELTQDEYHKLRGLWTLLKENVRQNDAYERACYRILGVDGYDDGGFILSDEIFSKMFSLDEILDNWDIEVKEEEPQREYPYKDGPTIVLGPEVFLSEDGQVVCYQGVNYQLQGA